jgi:hypothetical protein
VSPLFRRRAADPAAPEIGADAPAAAADTPAAAPAPAAVPAPEGLAPRRPHAGLLRRERRTLLKAREGRLRDLGGLLVEMYRRGGFRDDLLAEGCADVVGIDARLSEIDDLLHTRRNAPRCECGAPILRRSHFCPNCGRPLAPATANGAGSQVQEETMIEPAAPGEY